MRCFAWYQYIVCDAKANPDIKHRYKQMLNGFRTVLYCHSGVCCYVLLLLLDIKIENRRKKIDINFKLAGDHLYGKGCAPGCSL